MHWDGDRRVYHFRSDHFWCVLLAVTKANLDALTRPLPSEVITAGRTEGLQSWGDDRRPGGRPVFSAKTWSDDALSKRFEQSATNTGGMVVAEDRLRFLYLL